MTDAPGDARSDAVTGDEGSGPGHPPADDLADATGSSTADRADDALGALVAAYRTTRARLIDDAGLSPGEVQRSLTEATDAFLAEVFRASVTSTGVDATQIALVALGGYGRGALFPGSDLDVAVVHDGHDEAAAKVAEAVWYPIWDTGISLGHSVRSLDEVSRLVASEVESATALLDARWVAGDTGVVDALTTRMGDVWASEVDKTLEWLREDVTMRRQRFGEVAFATEPDLKNGGGGLRDAQVISWINRARNVVEPGDADALTDAARHLADVRVTLHRSAPKSGDTVHLEDQDAIAAVLAEGDADVLMTSISQAARAVAWILDDVFHSAAAPSPKQARKRSKRRFSAQNTTVGRPDDLDPTDPTAVLDFAATVAASQGRIDRDVVNAIADKMPAPPEPWPTATRDAFIALLSAGPGMIDVVESLDHKGIWERFVPEWPTVHSRAQRSPHHRFTVDRHLLEAVANAAAIRDRVARPDLLVMSALLHDLGKGRGGNHSEIGTTIAADATTRMGFADADRDALVTLVAHHLLLSEMATRRDLADPTTIGAVADAVQTPEVLELLAALSEADGKATGPSAWTEWKAGLVRQLVEVTAAHLSGERVAETASSFPSVEQLQLLRAGITSVQGAGEMLTVAAPDRPGLFCRVTGAVTLSGLNVIGARATSEGGFALEQFRVAPAFASRDMAQRVSIDWDKVTATVERAMSGKLALAARVADRATTYRRSSRAADTDVRISFDDTSNEVTVVEVEAPDATGLLYRLTRALSEMDVDIRAARVETMTDRVVDAFSLTDATGALITDEEFRRELERALRDAVSP